MSDPSDLICPDCDDPLAYAFHDTAGVGAWKQGGGFNAIPDTAHFVCFGCAKCWKTRMGGPLTPDMIGDIAFFTCKQPDCGTPLTVTRAASSPTENELTCARGHGFAVVAGEDGGLTLRAR